MARRFPRFPVAHKRSLKHGFTALQQRRYHVMAARLHVFFTQQAERVVARYLGTTTATLEYPVWMGRLAWAGEVKETQPGEILPPEEDRRLQIVMIPDLEDQYIQSSHYAGQLVGADVPDPGDQRVRDYLLSAGGRIVDINDTTRDNVALTLALGGERGYNQYQIARGVPADNFPGLDDTVAQTYRNRSDTIVRTELSYANAQATLDTYREQTVEWVEVQDGDDCGWQDHDDPDLADGSFRTMDDADEYPIAHPNCVRVFLPSDGPPEGEGEEE